MSDADRLGGIHLFSELTEEKRVALAKDCGWLRFGRGHVIFDKESESRDVMFVVKGSVHVTAYALTGREISYAELGEGEFFGEIAALDGEPRSASVTAAGECEIAVMPPERFKELLDELPALANFVLRRMCAIIRRSGERLMDMTTLNARQRICMEVLRMAKPNPAQAGSWVIYPLPTQATIASRVGTSRETVGRVISDLVRGDVIRKKGRSVTIMDKEKLELHTRRLGDEE